jgi:hypothetical protein
MENYTHHKYKAAFWLLALLSFSTAYAQLPHDPYSAHVWKAKPREDFDTTSLWYAFKSGTISGHLRQFSMATLNKDTLPSYYALAIGGGIRYQTAVFHSFSFTLSGFFIYNIASTNFEEADENNLIKNRYEIGLYDVTDKSNRNDLDRLEELHITYHAKNGQAILGKQIINTPFINPQDGRMRPTEVSGLWMNWKSQSNIWEIEAGLFDRISPRATVKWYSIASSVGLYPQGVNSNGKPSAYLDSLSSRGIGYLRTRINLNRHLKVQVLNQFVENIFNTFMVQVNTEKAIGSGRATAAAQYIRQDAVNNGGSTNKEHSYFEPGSSSHTFGARVGWKNSHWETSLNYTSIAKSGRFLMPREWGREPLFTFLQRERSEGLGDLHAYMAKLSYAILPARWSADMAVGIYDLPAIHQYAHNKYGMPSYGQFNTGMAYRFDGFWKGLQTEILYVYKWNRDPTTNDPKNIGNKVDMSNLNLVFNYHF